MPDQLATPQHQPQPPRQSRLRAAAAMLRIGWHADPRRSLLAVGLGILDALASSLFALWLKLLLDAVRTASHRLGIVVTAGLAASVVGTSVSRYAGARVRAVLVDRAHHLVQRRLVEVVGRTPTLEIHETPQHLTQLEILLGREGWEFGQVIPSLLNLMTLAVRIVATGVLLVGVHPLLLVLPIFALPALLLSSKIGSAVSIGHDKAAEPTRRYQHVYELATTASAAKEVRLFRLGEELLDRFDRSHRQMQQIRRRVMLQTAAIGIATRLVFLIGYFAAIGFVVYRVLGGKASVGDAALAAVLAGQVLGFVTGSTELIAWVSRTLTAAGRFVYLEDVSRQAHARVDSSASVPLRLLDGIRLTNVSYRYPHSRAYALQHVNLHLPRGTTIAVVGDNGAGKTTLVKLLAGLYPPSDGQITIDGVDLAELDPDVWRQRITAGFQDHARFEFLLRETVGIGNLAVFDDETRADAAVYQALDRAGATDVLTSLPDRLDTQLGPSWPAGVDLSGGQWQKLAVGRAMMRTDPLLLLLDEPTAALDADTEHRLFERWTSTADELRRTTGAITVLVSHRFSTVRMADLIVVLAGGEIVETGDHDQLIARGGLYAELFGLQARSYQ